MTDQNTQTAVDETKAPALPGAEVGQDAQTDGADLDKLLKEFDTTVAPSTATPQTAPAQPQASGDDLAKLVEDHVGRALDQHQAKLKIETQYNALIEKIHTDTGASQRLVRGFIEELGRANPELGTKYFNAKTDAERNRIAAAVTREFQKDFKATQIDEAATADHAAVTAAVRGASQRAPEAPPPDFSRMTDAEFAQAKDKMLG